MAGLSCSLGRPARARARARARVVLDCDCDLRLRLQAKAGQRGQEYAGGGGQGKRAGPGGQGLTWRSAAEVTYVHEDAATGALQFVVCDSEVFCSAAVLHADFETSASKSGGAPVRVRLGERLQLEVGAGKPGGRYALRALRAKRLRPGQALPGQPKKGQGGQGGSGSGSGRGGQGQSRGGGGGQSGWRSVAAQLQADLSSASDWKF